MKKPKLNDPKRVEYKLRMATRRGKQLRDAQAVPVRIPSGKWIPAGKHRNVPVGSR